ncbi:twin-arginine translocation signal domain-containing protein [Segetibacter aerophilus]|uniref:Uncharacterized protein n=1 Tax=Segetibacter aerophilus TaxID=670293 RepID=A0A512B956_9BACT|nr:twin-arginine translocation signal domain-containing protein [Segetibacter aerophilus]GEO08504.1 hypothetical protein SAE01_10000 [Segetibacter aerophilus]
MIIANEEINKRRSFLKNTTIGSVGAALAPTFLLEAKAEEAVVPWLQKA